jgi:hypothetical protein
MIGLSGHILIVTSAMTGGADSVEAMKAGNPTKKRLRVQRVGRSWTLLVDGRPVIRTEDGHWIRRFAVQLRLQLADDAILKIGGPKPTLYHHE